MLIKALFSVVHKHKHKDIRTRKMAYFTQFLIPALLNPMINKMADEASTISLLICSHEVWVKVTHDWSTVPRPFAYACAYVDPVFPCQSYDISISTSTRRTNLSVFLVLILMLMSTQFSLGYTCAYVHASVIPAAPSPPPPLLPWVDPRALAFF